MTPRTTRAEGLLSDMVRDASRSVSEHNSARRRGGDRRPSTTTPVQDLSKCGNTTVTVPACSMQGEVLQLLLVSRGRHPGQGGAILKQRTVRGIGARQLHGPALKGWGKREAKPARAPTVRWDSPYLPALGRPWGLGRDANTDQAVRKEKGSSERSVRSVRTTRTDE